MADVYLARIHVMYDHYHFQQDEGGTPRLLERQTAGIWTAMSAWSDKHLQRRVAAVEATCVRVRRLAAACAIRREGFRSMDRGLYRPVSSPGEAPSILAVGTQSSVPVNLANPSTVF